MQWFMGMAGVFTAALTLLALPWLAKVAIDDGIGNDDMTVLVWVAVLVVGLVALGWAARVARMYYMYRVSDELAVAVQAQLFEHIHRLPMRCYESTDVGTLVSRLTNDVTAMRTLFNTGLMKLIKSIVILVGGAALMFVLDWKMALITLGVVPVLVAMTTLYRKRAAPWFVEVRNSIAGVTSYAQRTLNWMSVIQSYNQQRRHSAEFATVNAENRRTQMQTVKLGAVYYPSTQLLSALAKGLLVIYGGFQVLDGSVSAGEMVAFFGVVSAFFWPIGALAQVFQTYEAGIAAIDKIFEVLHEEPMPDPPGSVAQPRDGRIEFDDVGFAHVEGHQILDQLDLAIESGANLALCGSRGGGKSTIGRLIVRLYDVDSGNVRVGGIDVRDLPQSTLRRHVGYVGSHPEILAGTLRENVRLLKSDISDDDIAALIAKIAGDDFISRFPAGMDTLLTQGGTNISAGEVLVVSLARVLIADPAVVIVDEMTDALDSLTADEVDAALSGIMRDRTVIAISRRLEVLRAVDEVVVIENGQVVDRGPHAELVRSVPVYRRHLQNWIAG